MSILTFLLLPIIIPILSRIFWSHKITIPEMVAQIAIMCLAVTIIWNIGKFTKSVDVEILNGKVLSK